MIRFSEKFMLQPGASYEFKQTLSAIPQLACVAIEYDLQEIG